MIGVAFISDRGDRYLPKCMESMFGLARFDRTKIIDDSNHELGMAGAVNAAWQWALDENVDYLLHVEEDFVFHSLPLDGMRVVLLRNKHLAQVVLKRQPWSSEEIAAGGQIEVSPGDYIQRDGYVEHRRLFSLNPCLIPRRTLELGVPVGDPRGFEAAFTERCLEAGLVFGYFGDRNDPPRCEHVGTVRAGAGWRW